MTLTTVSTHVVAGTVPEKRDVGLLVVGKKTQLLPRVFSNAAYESQFCLLPVM
jgi:hypothetical protein